MKDFARLVRLAFWASLGAAVYQELRKPPEERTWHWKVGGVVPYDFRIPTLERLRDAYWNPETDQIFTDRVFGVGWAVNIPAAAQKLREIVSQYLDANRKH